MSEDAEAEDTEKHLRSLDFLRTGQPIGHERFVVSRSNRSPLPEV